MSVINFFGVFNKYLNNKLDKNLELKEKYKNLIQLMFHKIIKCLLNIKMLLCKLLI